MSDYKLTEVDISDVTRRHNGGRRGIIDYDECLDEFRASSAICMHVGADAASKTLYQGFYNHLKGRTDVYVMMRDNQVYLVKGARHDR